MFTKTSGKKSLPDSRWIVAIGLATFALTIGAPASAAKAKPIISTLQEEGTYSTFLKAINTAGLAKTLHGRGPYTIFAPTDAAFSKLPPSQLNALMANPAQMKKLVGFHIIHGKLTSEQLAALKTGATPVTLEGDPLHVATAAGVVSVNGATIIKPDVSAKNGVIQEVDTVLMPPVAIAVPSAPSAPPAPPANPPARVTPPAPAPAQPPASPPTAPTSPPGQPPANSPGVPVSPPMQPANPPGAPVNPPAQPANPPGAPGTSIPEQPAPAQPGAPAPANPPADNSPAR
ncbi:MAG TPA: fasciclin domain-containing protein [Capsulimonadaceae bacterium]|nr:fasciclin domain-containing protein [Capsulimonadaceae bacterium]